MISACVVLLRRRGTGHVVKYLEGVPTPTKLIDHLAGANLHASSELPFFNTVPRYIDTQREQRLSKLFFHHVLFPAGGARLPYQAVVVRGGRAVQPSRSRVMRRRKTADAAALPSSLSKAPPTNLLAVPATQLGSSLVSAVPTSSSSAQHLTSCATRPARSAAAVLADDMQSAAVWARVDPARRPYFSAGASSSAYTRQSAYHNAHADSGPTATHAARRTAASQHASARDTEQTVRAVDDSVLAPLRGVVEQYWRASPAAEERVRQLLIAPAGGLLWMPGQAESASTAPPLSRAWDGLLKQAQRKSAIPQTLAASQAATSPFSTTQAATLTYAYVQTRLPGVATVALPVPHNASHTQNAASADDEDTFLYRMAAGVEPVVPFAVGRPLLTSAAPTAPEATGTTTSKLPSVSDDCFSHVTCLARLNLQLPFAAASPSSAPVSASGAALCRTSRTGASPSFSRTAEPWRLGDGGLDLTLPQQARTVAERHPAKPTQMGSTRSHTDSEAAQRDVLNEGRYVLGRQDAETYLLPQRELLLTLHVPKRTEEMCVAQNEDRLQRQVRAGVASRPAVAWPTEHARMTSTRRALGRFMNAESAGSSTTQRDKPSMPPSALTASASNGGLLHSRTSYEVRALPGDVVYIPRGWGFDVQRILGTATIYNGHEARDGKAGSLTTFVGNHALADPSRMTHSASLQPQSPSSNATTAHDCGTRLGSNSTDITPPQVTSAEVDAFCLNYHPYPELTAAQAAMYVAANYVQRGVEDFYAKGGNEVFRSYT